MADSPEHTIFICPRWEGLRDEAHCKIVREVTTSNVSESLLESEDNWARVIHMMRSIMKGKELEERRREQVRIKRSN